MFYIFVIMSGHADKFSVWKNKNNELIFFNKEDSDFLWEGGSAGFLSKTEVQIRGVLNSLFT